MDSGTLLQVLALVVAIGTAVVGWLVKGVRSAVHRDELDKVRDEALAGRRALHQEINDLERSFNAKEDRLEHSIGEVGRDVAEIKGQLKLLITLFHRDNPNAG